MEVDHDYNDADINNVADINNDDITLDVEDNKDKDSLGQNISLDSPQAQTTTLTDRASENTRQVLMVLPKPSATPPPWKDLTRCQKCEAPFGFWVRDHHCRNCGGNFCAACTPKRIQLPKYGYLIRAVRVCDPCHTVVEKENLHMQAETRRKQKILTKSGRGGGLQMSQVPQPIHSDTCTGCNKPFTALFRSDWCRHCGKAVCRLCAEKYAPIPKFGYFVRKVKVCDPCFGHLHMTGQTSLNVVPLNISSDSKANANGDDDGDDSEDEDDASASLNRYTDTDLLR